MKVGHSSEYLITCCYLRVEEPVRVVSVRRALVQAVVAAARVVHVRVAQSHGEQGAKQAEKAQSSCHLFSGLSP